MRTLGPSRRSLSDCNRQLAVEEYHAGFGPSARQPATDLGESKAASVGPIASCCASRTRMLSIFQLVDLDPEGKYINSTRVRCGRSLSGYPL